MLHNTLRNLFTAVLTAHLPIPHPNQTPPRTLPPFHPVERTLLPLILSIYEQARLVHGGSEWTLGPRPSWRWCPVGVGVVTY